MKGASADFPRSKNNSSYLFCIYKQIYTEQIRIEEGLTVTWCQFGVIRNDAVRYSLPEANYIYTDASLCNRPFYLEIILIF
jgi:hypothetical protein